jgi:hypothetical protein
MWGIGEFANSPIRQLTNSPTHHFQFSGMWPDRSNELPQAANRHNCDDREQGDDDDRRQYDFEKHA